MANYGDAPNASDFSDLALIWAIPYVDAVTLDRRMRHYCAIATQSLLTRGGSTDFKSRLFTNLSAVQSNHPVWLPSVTKEKTAHRGWSPLKSTLP